MTNIMRYSRADFLVGNKTVYNLLHEILRFSNIRIYQLMVQEEKAKSNKVENKVNSIPDTNCFFVGLPE